MLKNEGRILPIPKNASVAIIGQHATPVVLGGGGGMFQGSAVRFCEHIDIEGRLHEASRAAKACDYAVICTGTINKIESEGFDRETMDLTATEYEMINTFLAVNPSKSVSVNFSGGPVGMTQFSDVAPAIMQVRFPSQEMGHSVTAI